MPKPKSKSRSARKTRGDAIDAYIDRLIARGAQRAREPRSAPKPLSSLLLPHQADRLAFIERRSAPDAPHFRGGIIADEMGVGKTLPAAAWVAQLVRAGQHVLMVLPIVANKAFARWFDQIRRHCGLEVRPTRFERTMTPSDMLRANPLVVTYAKLGAAHTHHTRPTPDVPPAEHMLFARRFHAVVMDEGAAMRTGERTTYFRAMMDVRADVRWALTGTAAQINPAADIANIISVVACRRVGVEEAMRIYPEVAVRLALSDVLSGAALPPRTDRVEYVDVAEAVAKAAHAERAAGNVLTARRILASPCAYDPACGLPDAKLDAAVALCERGTVFFSEWSGVLDVLEPRVHALGLTTAYLHGKLGSAARSAVEQQLVDGAADVALVTIGTGATSLDMTKYWRVVFISPVLNPSDMAQAAARVHRAGQTRAVTVVVLVARGTVDEEVYHRTVARAARADRMNNTVRRVHAQSQSSACSPAPSTP